MEELRAGLGCPSSSSSTSGSDGEGSSCEGLLMEGGDDDLAAGGNDWRFLGEFAEPVVGDDRAAETLEVEIDAGRPAKVAVEVEAPR